MSKEITIGNYENEDDAKQTLENAFSHHLISDLFYVFREVSGELLLKKSHKENKRVRVDFFLVPKDAAYNEGWQGNIAIEVKTSGKKIPIGQLIDYSDSQFFINDRPKRPRYVALFDFGQPFATTASTFAHCGILGLTEKYNQLIFNSGSGALLRIKQGEMILGSEPNLKQGYKRGSR